MHLWQREEWKSVCPPGARRGLRFRFDAQTDGEVRRAVLDFARWLRGEFDFPMRVAVYVRSAERLNARDGTKACGSFFGPFDHAQEPYIRIAAGEYARDKAARGRDDALNALLLTLAHELSHYYQWLNDLQLSDKGMERQASLYARGVVSEYAQTREHP